MNAKKSYFWGPEPEKKLVTLQQFTQAMTQELQTKYSVSAADITYLVRSRIVLKYLIDVMQAAANWAESTTQRRDSIFSLPQSVVLDMPVAPILPTLPTDGVDVILTFACGLDAVMTRVASEIKGKPNYDVADGDVLGIEGALILPPSPATTKPMLKAKIVSGGCPELGVKLTPFKSWELWADFGTGTFVLHQVGMKSKMLCEQALPATGQSAVWKFKAIYREGNAQFGQFSDVATVLVGGG